MTGVCTLTPCHVAVILAVVFAVTGLVGRPNETEALPGCTVTAAGGLAAEESLDRLTTAPPAGAWPFSMTIAPGCAPPLIVLGVIVSVFSEGGSTVNCPDEDPEFTVAVIVTGVEAVTCPACMVNWSHPVLGGMLTVGGTGATAGFELVRLMMAPLAGAAATELHGNPR